MAHFGNRNTIRDENEGDGSRYRFTLPLCPDHRDKVRGKNCLQCRVEFLENSLRRVTDRLRPDMAPVDIVNLLEYLAVRQEMLDELGS